MNTNKINAIEDRKGDEGWEQQVEGDTLVALTKTFQFDQFEKGAAFVQAVSSYADKKDHHPEWKSENGGLLIHVKLTSHFAGNTVSLLDYELAEQMNNAYNDTQSTFNMFPMFDTKQLLSACVGVGSFVVVYSTFQYLTMSAELTDTQRGKPLPFGKVSNQYTKSALNVEEIEKLGVDAFVDKNLTEQSFLATTGTQIPSQLNFR